MTPEHFYLYLGTFQADPGTKNFFALGSYFDPRWVPSYNPPLNVRGVTSKLDQIKVLLVSYNFSTLGLSETFLHVSKPSSFYHIDSCEMVRVDRIGRSGGGILCYLKSG